jgi:hypothetical protein
MPGYTFLQRPNMWPEAEGLMQVFKPTHSFNLQHSPRHYSHAYSPANGQKQRVGIYDWKIPAKRKPRVSPAACSFSFLFLKMRNTPHYSIHNTLAEQEAETCYASRQYIGRQRYI